MGILGRINNEKFESRTIWNDRREEEEEKDSVEEVLLNLAADVEKVKNR